MGPSFSPFEMRLSMDLHQRLLAGDMFPPLRLFLDLPRPALQVSHCNLNGRDLLLETAVAISCADNDVRSISFTLEPIHRLINVIRNKKIVISFAG